MKISVLSIVGFWVAQQAICMAQEPDFTLPDHRFVAALGFTPDSQSIVCVTWDKAPDRDATRFVVRSWDVAAKKLDREVELEWDQAWNRAAGSMILSKDCKKIISIVEKQVGIWDVGTGKLVRRLTLPEKLRDEKRYYPILNLLASSPDLSRIACGWTVSLGGVAPVAYAVVWDANTGDVVQTIKCAMTVQYLAFSPDAKKLVAGGMQRNADVWEIATGKLLLNFRNANPDVHHPDPEVKQDIASLVMSCAFSPDGTRLAVADMIGVKLIDAASGKVLLKIDAPFRYHSGHPSFDFSADGELLSLYGTNTGKERSLPIWSTATGKLVMSLQVDASGVTYSGDRQLVAVGRSDLKQAIAVWRLRKPGK